MKLTRELKQFKAEIFVFTGDGSRDEYILSFMSERFNGKEKYLWYPKSPIRKGLKETGLKPLNSLIHYIMNYNLERFLFLIDREHFNKENQPSKQINNRLELHKVSIDIISSLIDEKAFILTGSYYNKSFDLCVVIFGIEANIEEEISQLIKEIYGIQLEPQKDVIERFLKSRKIDLKSIIESARMKQLERAFPGLFNALKWIEHQK